MLLHYHVKNFALIEEAEIEFGPGLNIFTGETGAGKSLLIDALSCCLGARTGPEVIRRGADSAYIELVFMIPPQLKERIAGLGVNTEYDCIVISRRIYPTRSVHKINDETVTSAKVREVTELLLDIHGQHEHQSLLKPSRQLEILDEFSGADCLAQIEKVSTAYSALQEARNALTSFSLSKEEKRRRMDFLQYEIDEINAAQVEEGELGSLTERYKELSSREKIETDLRQCLNFLEDGRENVSDLLSRAERELRSAAQHSSALEGIAQALATSSDLLSAAGSDIRAYLDSSDFSPEAFYEVEKRLDELHRLSLKYGDLSSPDNTALKEREAELASLREYEERLTAALKTSETAEKEALHAALKLHDLRAAAAPLLSSRLEVSLRELNFQAVDFSVDLRQTEQLTAHGIDEIGFLISLNAGEERKPLQKVASGGELSRIMLAIKTILAEKDSIPTVIFDEIDTGISGETAQRVGEKLKEISYYRQVIVVTHLAQIAAPADSHFGIFKRTDGSRTFTHIEKLDEKKSLEELARLLGGDLRSDSVYQTARELKRSGQNR